MAAWVDWRSAHLVKSHILVGFSPVSVAEEVEVAAVAVGVFVG